MKSCERQTVIRMWYKSQKRDKERVGLEGSGKPKKSSNPTTPENQTIIDE